MSREDIARGYDAMLGMPSAKMKRKAFFFFSPVPPSLEYILDLIPFILYTESLQDKCREIKKVGSWKQFFQHIGVKCPAKQELVEWCILFLSPAWRNRFGRD